MKKKIILLTIIVLILGGGLLALLLFPSVPILNQLKIKQGNFDTPVLVTKRCEAMPLERIASDFGATPCEIVMKAGSMNEINETLQLAFQESETFPNLFIELNPTNSDEHKLLELLSIMQAHPDTTFQLFFAPHSKADLTTMMSQLGEQTYIDLYRKWSEQLLGQPNVHLYYFDNQDWMRYNPYFFNNQNISSDGMLYVFSSYVSGMNRLDLSNYSVAISDATILSENKSAIDLKGQTIFCFGDSILGKHVDESGTLNLVSAYTQAEIYNFAVCGATASSSTNKDLASIVVALCEEEPTTLNMLTEQATAESAPSSYTVQALQEARAVQPDIILVEYGFNDYSLQVTPNVTAGSFAEELRCNIEILQQHYPDAEIILFSPMTCEWGNYGKETFDGKYTLEDYANASEALADEMQIQYMNNYMTEDLNSDTISPYLLDGVHLNEAGRYMLALRIMDLLGNILHD